MEIRSTERQNSDTRSIDTLTAAEIMRIINREDHKVADAVETQIPQIAEAVEQIYMRLQAGGRMFYCGAGSSGRIGILDAAECVPTYNVSPNLVQGLISGGREAVFDAAEGEEDDRNACREELKKRDFGQGDVLIGIAASGTTPYVMGGLQYAKRLGALTISIACNENPPIAQYSDISITPVTGPEVITGSTRMKAGTAQKMVLNMISTGVMIRLGKVYKNLMVDVQVSNAKLADRARRIVSQAAEVEEETAVKALEECSGEVKTAIVYLKAKVDKEEARRRLKSCGGVVRKALQEEL